MKIELDLDKPIYDYVRYRKIDLNAVVNRMLRLKYHLGRDETKPQIYLPMERSIELGLTYLNTDIHNPQSIQELVNYIVRLYPYTNEESVMATLGKILKKKHKYDRFV